MSTNFAIIGGDLRIVNLAKMLADEGNKIYTYGLEKIFQVDEKYNKLNNYENIIHCKNIDDENFDNAKIIISAIPFSKDDINIYAPYANQSININNVLSRFKNKILISGNVSNSICDIANEKSIKIIDVISNEKLAILNCISTAEGAIQLAMQETDKIIHGSNVLILGFGRIGKVLSKKLQGLSCNVTCAARKETDFAWIKAYGYDLTNINLLSENLYKYDIIFNTVPHLILNKERLEYINQECILIELASKPGGIDREEVKIKNIKVIDALGLPGKVAPYTSAEIIKDVIYETIKK